MRIARSKALFWQDSAVDGAAASGSCLCLDTRSAQGLFSSAIDAFLAHWVLIGARRSSDGAAFVFESSVRVAGLLDARRSC